MTPILNAIYEGHVDTVKALLAAVSAFLLLPTGQAPPTCRLSTLC